MWHRAVLCSLLATAGAAQQSGAAAPQCPLDVRGALGGIRVTGAGEHRAAGASLHTELPAGTWRLRFAAAQGCRPAPLTLAVPPGARVAVAVATGAPAAGIPTADAPGMAAPEPLAAQLDDARTFARGTQRDVLLQVRLRQADGAAAAGLVVRSVAGTGGAGGEYRLVRDPAAAELRLERRLGEAVTVLARQRIAADTGWHDLELEAAGFRLAAWYDGEPVARELDGALGHGDCGTFVAPGGTAEFAALVAAAPALPATSAAAVVVDRTLDYVAAAPDHVAEPYLLLLGLDRPTVAWPTTDGFEPALLVRLAEPVFLVGFGCGQVGDDGAIQATLRWPDGVALRGQAALVGGHLGSPDGSELRARLPWVGLRL